MSQQNDPSSSSVTSSQLDSQPQVFDCRWGWCRFSTLSSISLAGHIVQEHVRNATPVRRRDIPMLRRVEEGIGESLSLSLKKMVGGSYDIVGSRTVNGSDATDQDFLPHPRPLSAQNPHTSSLPSPRGSLSPHGVLKHSLVLSKTHSPPQNNANAERICTATTPPSYEPEHGHSVLPPARDSCSSSPSPPVTPNTPFTTFAALSSPLAPYSSPSVPASPSFNSKVANVLRGTNNLGPQIVPSSFGSSDSPTKRRKIEVADKPVEWPPYHLSHSQSHDSQSSSYSCDLVEKQLTQSSDLDINVHGTTISDGDSQQKPRINADPGPGSISKERENILVSYPSGEGQAEGEMHAAKQPASQSQSKSESESQPQPRPQPIARTQHEIPASPLVQHKVQRQAWYQLSPYKSHRTRTHSQSTILSMSGTSTPTSQPRSPPPHPNTPNVRSHPDSLLQSVSANSFEPPTHGQSRGQSSTSGPLFHSGSLQVHPGKGPKTALTMDVFSQPAMAGAQGGNREKEDGDDAMHIYEDQSPTVIEARKRSNSRIEHFDLQSQFSQSHSSTDGSPTSMGLDSRPFSYGFLTQAPYQSQSLSQSQS